MSLMGKWYGYHQTAFFSQILRRCLFLQCFMGKWYGYHQAALFSQILTWELWQENIWLVYDITWLLCNIRVIPCIFRDKQVSMWCISGESMWHSSSHVPTVVGKCFWSNSLCFTRELWEENVWLAYDITWLLCNIRVIPCSFRDKQLIRHLQQGRDCHNQWQAVMSV